MLQACSTVVVLGTGGTIAGQAADAATTVGYASGALAVEALVAGLALRGVVVESETVAQMNSKDMDAATWRRLAVRAGHHAHRPDVAGIVVTHGTDTLEETAWWLALTVATPKPIVLTGAMRPASSRSADGPQNIADAIAIAAWPGATGVVAVMAGAVHGARDVRKFHPYRVDAFSSGDAGPIGYVEEGRLRAVRGWPAPAMGSMPNFESDAAWPRVEIIASHAGADGRIVGLLVDDGVDGIVVAATGNGEIHHALDAALQAARRRGVAVMRCARGEGAIVVGVPDDPREFQSAEDLTPGKARVELLVRLLGLPRREPCRSVESP